MAVMAAHMPPAEAPEITSIDTLCFGTDSLSNFAVYQASRASVRKSSTPAVYAPAEIAPAMLIAILKVFTRITPALWAVISHGRLYQWSKRSEERRVGKEC